MSFELPGKSSRRRSILQGVYEDNLRIDHPPDPEASEASEEAPVRRSRWLRARWLGVALLFVVLTGWAYQRFAVGAADRAKAEEVVEAPPPVLELPPAPAPALDFVVPADLSVAGLFGLEVHTIVIDAGHGGVQEGAVGPTGLEEKVVTLDVARRLRACLERYPGYEILLTRAWDETMSLQERVDFANMHDADLFISIHVNWIPAPEVRVIETYYFGQGDSTALALARRENRNSGYSVAAFNDMLEEVGSTMRLQESRKLARSIQQNLYGNVRKLTEEVESWGVKTAPFVVLLGVEAPSVLAEIGVLSNRAAEARLPKPAYREKLAAFLEQGIVDYLHTRFPAPTADRSP